MWGAVAGKLQGRDVLLLLSSLQVGGVFGESKGPLLAGQLALEVACLRVGTSLLELEQHLDA